MATAKKEILRQLRQENVLMDLGFSNDEANRLRRISMTLHRWHEWECGTEKGCVARDETTGKTYWISSMTGKRWPTPDRETGAMKRLETILEGRNVSAYIQTDPRGAALYILRPGDVPKGGDVNAYYSRGICVY